MTASGKSRRCYAAVERETAATDHQACRFRILTADGTESEHFEQKSVKEIMPFLNQFIITAAFSGDLKIWSANGQELISQFLGFSLPLIVWDEQARLVIFRAIEESFRTMTTFDFGASKARDSRADTSYIVVREMYRFISECTAKAFYYCSF